MLDMATLWRNLHSGGDKAFLISRSASATYGEVKDLVIAAMTFYREQGLKPGDRVGVLYADEVKSAAAFSAALFSGLVPIMLPPDIGQSRLEGIVSAVEPSLVARGPELFRSNSATAPSLAPIASDELAYLLFTSGTTAAPTGVEITRGNLLAHLQTLIRLFDFNASSRVFNPTPLSHTDGLIFGPMLALASGGAVIRPGPFNLSDVSSWLGMLKAHRATHMVTNPTVLSLIDRGGDKQDAFAFEGFSGILSSASQLRPDFWRHFETRFGTQISNLYGLTETVTSALYAGRHPEMGPVGTLGKPIDCEARIATPVRNIPSEPDGDVGELQLRGPHIFKGYWRNPARNAETFTEDGWMRTGDLVRKNADGSYLFLGRVKAAINCGGTLIRGEEIDECLLRHPRVAEAVTIGIADPDFEEIPVTAVVLSQPVSEAELTEYCRGNLEQLKVPKRIIAVAAIPRGDAGKPNLQALRDLLRNNSPAAGSDTVKPDDHLERDVIELAALVFRSDPSKLTLASGPDDVEGWDSYTHVNLLLQAEDTFNVRIPGSALGKVKTLEDLHRLIADLKPASAPQRKPAP